MSIVMKVTSAIQRIINSVDSKPTVSSYESSIRQTKHHALPCPACGDPNPYRHCHTAEERSAAIKAKGGFDWMQATR